MSESTARDYEGTLEVGETYRGRARRDEASREWRLVPLPRAPIHIATRVEWTNGDATLEGETRAEVGVAFTVLSRDAWTLEQVRRTNHLYVCRVLLVY